MKTSVTVNGTPRDVEIDPRLTLVYLLRETLGLTGTHVGCTTGNCGACTVLLDGKTVKSCSIFAADVDGSELVTIEGLSTGMRELHPVQQAWIDHQVPQCGYCQSGMIMAVSALLASQPHPTDQQVDEAITNICRCGTFARVRRAIQALASPDAGPVDPASASGRQPTPARRSEAEGR